MLLVCGLLLIFVVYYLRVLWYFDVDVFLKLESSCKFVDKFELIDFDFVVKKYLFVDFFE